MKIYQLLFALTFIVSLFSPTFATASSKEGKRRAAKYIHALPAKSHRTPASYSKGKHSKRSVASKKLKKTKKIAKKSKSKKGKKKSNPYGP